MHRAPCTGTLFRMATYTRRIVYLSDPQWAALQRQAQAEHTSISALIRALLSVPVALRAAHSAQAGRDALLSKINRR